jgi:tetratricopeptide (TPR) repeat protein
MILTETQVKELAVRMNVGIVRWCERKPDAAIKHFQDLLAEFEAAGDSLLLAKLHNNLGLAFRLKAEMSGDLGYLDLTSAEYEKVKYYLNQIDDLPAIGVVETNIGFLDLTLERFSEAHEHLNVAEEILESFNDAALLSRVWETRARVFFAEGKGREAKAAINKSEQLLMGGVEMGPLAETLKTKEMIYAADRN